MVMTVHGSVAEQSVETPYPDSPWVVMKFGGRSVATAENWAKIAGLVRARLDEGVVPVVVHSALAGVSNALIDLLETAEHGAPVDAKLAQLKRQHDALASDLGVERGLIGELFEKLEQMIAGVRLIGEVSPRVHARVLATGELAATTLGAAYLKRVGLDAVWLDARELLVAKTLRDQSERAQFLSARCDYGVSEELKARFRAAGKIIITQGFIARNAD